MRSKKRSVIIDDLSDVFDLASLVVARLDLLHKTFKRPRMPREVYYPGKKIPSDVYQQVGILEQQLMTLRSLLWTQGMPQM